jgi:hypothetical protein
VSSLSSAGERERRRHKAPHVSVGSIVLPDGELQTVTRDIQRAGCENSTCPANWRCSNTPLAAAHGHSFRPKAPRLKTGCKAMNLAWSSGRELSQELFEGLFSRSASGLNGLIEGR